MPNGEKRKFIFRHKPPLFKERKKKRISIISTKRGFFFFFILFYGRENVRDKKRFERDNVPATNVNFMIGLQRNVKMSQNMIKKRPCKIFILV